MMVPFALDITLTRRPAGSYVSGTWVPAATTATTIRASVQPAKFSSIMRLPEGLRTRGVVDVFSESELLAANEATGIEGDMVSWQGEQWEVQIVDAWLDGHHAPELGHWRAVAVRVDR